MYGPLTRAQMRDECRRWLDQVPPIDDGTGIAGAQPEQDPWPTNPQINHRLDDAWAWVSRKGDLSSDPTPRYIPIGPQTDPGPYRISLAAIAPSHSINEVNRVAWVNAVGEQETLLIAEDRYNMDRTIRNYMTQQPATPQRQWEEGRCLLIWPAPSEAGVLSVMFGQAMWSQNQNLDGETIETIPTDYMPLGIYRTVWMLCASQPNDEVLAVIAGTMEKLMADMLPDYVSFCARRNRSYQGRLIGALSGRGASRTGMMQGRR